MSSSNIFSIERIQPSHLDIYQLQSHKVQKVFGIFLDLLSSCAGPSGKIHITQNSRKGHVTLTSTCARLLASVHITNPELRLIVSAVQSHLTQFNDCGLFMACVCLHLIKSSSRTAIHFHFQRSMHERFLQIIVDVLKSIDHNITVKADFTDLQVLLAYVKSILNSKRLLNVSYAESKKLSELILKVFVESIPTQSSNTEILHTSGVYIIGVEKSFISESKMEHGLLLEYPELSALGGCVDVKSNLRGENGTYDKIDLGGLIKVALFTCSMSGDMEGVVDATFKLTQELHENVEKRILDKMLDLCDSLEKCKVGLVLCQKVIHPKLKSSLRSKGILFIERLGSQKIPYLQDLTRARPIATILVAENLPDHLGCVDSISHVVMYDRSYLHLTNTACNVVTLILCAQWEERLSELKNCVKTSLQGLYSLSKDPRLLPGGGCWQIYCSYKLRDKILMQLPAISEEMDCTAAQVLSSLAVFRSSLHYWVRSLANSSQEVLVDLSSLHSWRVPKGFRTNKPNDKVTACCCGLTSVSTVCLKNFHEISDNESASSYLCSMLDLTQSPVVKNTDFSNLVLDNLLASVQALDRAVSTANLVLSIGVFLIDKN